MIETVDKYESYIHDGGFYDSRNIWNSVVLIKDKPYRHRVETLIIKENKFIFLKMDCRFGRYAIPGGSVEKDVDNIIQAENEVNEEARICITNIRHSNITYIEDYVGKPRITTSDGKPFNYTGKYNEIYIADFDGRCRISIPSALADYKMANDGRFYKIEDVYHLLKAPHKKILEKNKLI